MVQRSIDITLSVIASIVSLLLSWPYWRRFEYWAESRGWWQVYMIVGFLLAVYVFFVFFRALRTLFVHEGPGHGHHHAHKHEHEPNTAVGHGHVHSHPVHGNGDAGTEESAS
ncbi:MAG TPA: hypothetical protein VF168_05080 [Trueperaceae bacterium]